MDELNDRVEQVLESVASLSSQGGEIPNKEVLTWCETLNTGFLKAMQQKVDL